VSTVNTFSKTAVIALLTGAVALAAQTPPPAPAGTVGNGRKLYVKNGCAACHGLEGQGAPTSGPRIGPNPLPLAAFIKYIRSPKNQMPPYTGKVMSDQELTDVRAFLAARSKPAAVTVLAP
jgi:ubiquinol-cytochrome c reductase cytochrome c subunit